MPLSMARFQEQAGPLNANFLQYVKDVDKAQTANQISRAGYTNRTGLQTWRAPDVAQQELGKVSTDSGVSLGALMSLAHMRNKNFTLDFAQLSSEVEVAAQQADTGGLTGLNREKYIMSALMGSAPNIVNGQLQLTDEQKINIRNLNKNRASFGDPAVLNYSANLRGSFQQYGSDVTPMSATMPGPTEYQIAVPGKTPEERAWLRTTRYAEGGRGYNIMFGGSTFQGTAHPRRINTAGGYSSDAAGAYQFLSTTWDDISKKLGLKGGMTPANQDEASLGLMVEKGVDPRKGWSREALYKLSPVWASFPKDKSDRSYYDQPSKTTAEMEKVYAHFLQQERQRDQQRNTMI
jgi:muramidase (phage lysozyme)